jgi:hypothetical protein
MGEGESLDGSGQYGWQVLLEAIIEVILIFNHLDHDIAPNLLQLSPSCDRTVSDQQLYHFLAQQGEFGGDDLIGPIQTKLQ